MNDFFCRLSSHPVQKRVSVKLFSSFLLPFSHPLCLGRALKAECQSFEVKEGAFMLGFFLPLRLGRSDHRSPFCPQLREKKSQFTPFPRNLWLGNAVGIRSFGHITYTEGEVSKAS